MNFTEDIKIDFTKSQHIFAKANKDLAKHIKKKAIVSNNIDHNLIAKTKTSIEADQYDFSGSPVVFDEKGIITKRHYIIEAIAQLSDPKKEVNFEVMVGGRK
jgi:hypothetical protein